MFTESEKHMRIAINQPYFFPYLGYFSLIKHVDHFILMDTVQYTRGWISRNRILHPSNGWQYIQVPLKKHEQTAKISEAIICEDMPWQKRMLGQLSHYKKPAPYYSCVIDIISDIFQEPESSLSRFNAKALKKVCHYLGVETPISNLSELELGLQSHSEADEFSLRICQALGYVSEYWNLPGGKSFYRPQIYKDSGIEIHFQQFRTEPYDQRRADFTPALSVLDAMMFLPAKEISNRLDCFDLL